MLVQQTDFLRQHQFVKLVESFQPDLQMSGTILAGVSCLAGAGHVMPSRPTRGKYSRQCGFDQTDSRVPLGVFLWTWVLLLGRSPTCPEKTPSLTKKSGNHKNIPPPQKKGAHDAHHYVSPLRITALRNGRQGIGFTSPKTQKSPDNPLTSRAIGAFLNAVLKHNPGNHLVASRLMLTAPSGRSKGNELLPEHIVLGNRYSVVPHLSRHHPQGLLVRDSATY